jgi:hypothetical protein
MIKLTTILAEQYGGGEYSLPSEHKAGIKVPKGGACCANCKYWDNSESACENKHFYKWAETDQIPVAPDEYCSDWWEPMNLQEASLSNDANKSEKAKGYITKIKELINNYRSDNKEIKVKGLGNLSYIELYLDNFIVNILPTDKGSTKAQFKPAVNGGKPSIDVYGARIKREPKLNVSFDEKDLYHEFVHLLDFNKIKTDPHDLDKSYQKQRDKHGYSGYINNPLEVNAHFFEYFMPEVIKFIEKEKEIPGSFDEFKRGLLSNPKAKEFIEDLNDKNRKKVMKRLGTYYNDILKNPNFKIEKGDNVDSQQLKKATNGFISKLKSILKIK